MVTRHSWRGGTRLNERQFIALSSTISQVQAVLISFLHDGENLLTGSLPASTPAPPFYIQQQGWVFKSIKHISSMPEAPWFCTETTQQIPSWCCSRLLSQWSCPMCLGRGRLFSMESLALIILWDLLLVVQTSASRTSQSGLSFLSLENVNPRREVSLLSCSQLVPTLRPQSGM